MERPDETAFPAACRLCEAAVPAGVSRCPACGLYQTPVLSAPTLWRLAAGLAAIYALVAAVTVLNR